MKAIVGELDQSGLRRLLPTGTDPNEALHRYGELRPKHPAALVWALLPNEEDAEDLRTDVAAGRHGEACTLLLNRAVELLTLSLEGPASIRAISMLLASRD
jgi:hypothetical protein